MKSTLSEVGFLRVKGWEPLALWGLGLDWPHPSQDLVSLLQPLLYNSIISHCFDGFIYTCFVFSLHP